MAPPRCTHISFKGSQGFWSQLQPNKGGWGLDRAPPFRKPWGHRVPHFQQLRGDSGRGNLAFWIQSRVPARLLLWGDHGEHSSRTWGGRWATSPALARELVQALHQANSCGAPHSTGVWRGWDSWDGEGEEQGGPDWGNWEKKTPKSEILAGGRAGEINLLLQQSWGQKHSRRRGVNRDWRGGQWHETPRALLLGVHGPSSLQTRLLRRSHRRGGEGAASSARSLPCLLPARPRLPKAPPRCSAWL